MDFRLTWYSAFWLSWVLAALVVELVAILHTAPHDTLSEHIWWLFGRRPFWVWLIGGFLAWLLVHLLSRGRWG